MGFVVLGLIFVSIEAGRPLKARYLLKNLRRSWMSRETLVIYIFVASCMLDILFSLEVFELTGLFAAALLLLTHGMIIYNSRGLPAWNVWVAVPVIIVSALVSGNAVLLILMDSQAPINIYFLIFTFCSMLLSSIFWIMYLYHSRNDPEFQFATKSLRRPVSMIIITGFGHIFPAVLILIIIYLVYFKNIAGSLGVITVITGVLAILGAFGVRYGIIRHAGYFRRIHLTKVVA